LRLGQRLHTGQPLEILTPRPKAPIEEGVKTSDILERMLEGEMKVILKELWTIALKLWTALKEILTSRRSNVDNKEVSRAPT